MGNILLMLGFIFLILGFHELAHIISAKIMRLKIYRVGFTLKPVPHFFVRVENSIISVKRNTYLFAGFFSTVVLLIISALNGFLELKPLCWAFIVQLIIETNPFYSDFVIFIINKKMCKYKLNYSAVLKSHLFSFVWYLHFIIWSVFIILLFKIKFM